MSIHVSKLSKEFSKSSKVLNCDALEIRPYELTVILGKNGSGKSTLLNCIGGLLPFESGTITVNIADAPMQYTLKANQPIVIPPAARLKIGHIFQQKALWNHLSVLKNLLHPLVKVHKLKREEAFERARHYLDRFEIEKALWGKYPGQLSGGQQRKVAVARTLAVEPELLLIDELEANLDHSALKLTMGIIEEMCVTRKKTVLMISHNIDLIEQFNPNIAVMHRGEVVITAKGAAELLAKEGRDKSYITLVNESVDSSTTRWFLARQSLMAAIKISEANLTEKDIGKLFTKLGQEISKLISCFEPEAEHLLLIATKNKKASGQADVKIRCAETSVGFVLNGKEAHLLRDLVVSKTLRSGQQQTYEFKKDRYTIVETGGGIDLEKKHDVQESGHNSLIDEMFDTNGENLEYPYSERHTAIKGAYHTAIPIPEGGREIERLSYYEFSKDTKSVYLISCVVNKEIMGVISVDTTSATKWSDFVIQQLILVGNMVAIAIKHHASKSKTI